MRVLLPPAALLALATACSTDLEGLEQLGSGGGGDAGPNGDDGDGGPNSGRDGSARATVTLAEYCAGMEAVELAKEAECYFLDEDYTERRLDALDARERCEADGDRYNFDPAAAADCLQRRERQDCGEYYFPWQYDQVASCERVFVGRGREGDSCRALDECGAGLICDVEPPLGACSRVCVPDHGSQRAGESCRTLHDCSEGLQCPMSVVPNRACYAPPGEGELCVPGEVEPCARGQSCSLITNRCQKLRGLDERCQFTNDCEPMLVCSGLQGEERCIWGQRAGEPCLEGQYNCYRETYCGADSVCVPRGITGDPCDPRIGARCAKGWYCEYSSSTCRLPEPSGAYCRLDEECASNFCWQEICRDRCE